MAFRFQAKNGLHIFYMYNIPCFALECSACYSCDSVQLLLHLSLSCLLVSISIVHTTLPICTPLQCQQQLLLQALQAGDADVPEIDNIDSAKRNAANLLEEESVDMPVEAELFGVAELAEMASMMLNMILELYGRAANSAS